MVATGLVACGPEVPKGGCWIRYEAADCDGACVASGQPCRGALEGTCSERRPGIGCSCSSDESGSAQSLGVDC